MHRNHDLSAADAGDVLRGLVAGLAGGLAGAAAMELFQRAWSSMSHQKQDDTETGKHNEQRGGQPQQQHADAEEPATVKTAEVISTRLLHHELTEQEKGVAGPAVHYTYGALVGGLYGATAEAVPVIALGGGSAYGVALWLLGDEIAVPALRLARPPTEHPLSTHVYALASHIIYGLTLEGVRRGLNAAMHADPRG